MSAPPPLHVSFSAQEPTEYTPPISPTDSDNGVPPDPPLRPPTLEEGTPYKVRTCLCFRNSCSHIISGPHRSSCQDPGPLFRLRRSVLWNLVMYISILNYLRCVCQDFPRFGEANGRIRAQSSSTRLVSFSFYLIEAYDQCKRSQ